MNLNDDPDVPDCGHESHPRGCATGTTAHDVEQLRDAVREAIADLARTRPVRWLVETKMPGTDMPVVLWLQASAALLFLGLLLCEIAP